MASEALRRFKALRSINRPHVCAHTHVWMWNENNRLKAPQAPRAGQKDSAL